MFLLGVNELGNCPQQRTCADSLESCIMRHGNVMRTLYVIITQKIAAVLPRHEQIFVFAEKVR